MFSRGLKKVAEKTERVAVMADEYEQFFGLKPGSRKGKKSYIIVGRGAKREISDRKKAFGHGLKKSATMGMDAAQRGMTGLRSAVGAMAPPKVKMAPPAPAQASSGLAGARVQMDAGTVARAGK